MRGLQRRSGQTKQQIKDKSFENHVFHFYFFLQNLPSMSFQRETQTEPCPQTIVSFISGHACPLGKTCSETGMLGANSPHSQPIKNFHGLGSAAANQCQAFVILVCSTSFMKSSVCMSVKIKCEKKKFHFNK